MASGASVVPDSPAEEFSTLVDGVSVLGALSPSRAGDFMSCPLKYRFRVIDHLPEPPTADAVRGTLVHKVLERLFDLSAAERTPERAATLVEPSWEEVRESEPGVRELFETEDEVQGWLAGCRAVVEVYFALEDPTRLEPAERELYVETVLDSKLLLRGFVDRVDIAPDGAIRIVDYKTGRVVGEAYEAKAFFQLKLYALVLWRMRGVVPRMLQLVYLGSGDVLRYEPDEGDLVAAERKINAIWQAIRAAEESRDWRPNPGRLCSWCNHQSLCPAFGGTPPDLPEK